MNPGFGKEDWYEEHIETPCITGFFVDSFCLCYREESNE
jgi:hypothetical protein